MRTAPSDKRLRPRCPGALPVRLEQIHGGLEERLHQSGGEMAFPVAFGFVPWRHHVEIITHCKSTEREFIEGLNNNSTSETKNLDSEE